MTTLIFVTEDHGAPIIHLEGANTEPVRAYLQDTLRPDEFKGCGYSTADFLRSLTPDLWETWGPVSLEAAPIFGIKQAAAYSIDLAWDPDSWSAWSYSSTAEALRRARLRIPDPAAIKDSPAYDTTKRAATRGVGFVCALLLAGSLLIGAAQAQMYPPYGSPGTPTMSGPFGGDSGFGNSTTIYTPPPIGSVPRVPSVYSPVPEPSQGPSNYPCTLPVGCR